MKSLSKLALGPESEEFRRFTFSVDEYFVHILYQRDKTNLITEAQRKNVTLGGVYSNQLHQPFTFVGQKDLYFYSKNNCLFALGIPAGKTSRDQSRAIRLPDKVAKEILNQFPDVNLAENHMIEPVPDSVEVLVKLIMLNEKLD